MLDGSTVRRLGDRWGVSPMTAWRRIERTLPKEIEVGTVVARRDLKSLSLILLDAKHFRVYRKKYTLYVAFDFLACRPCAWVLLEASEKREGYDVLLVEIHASRARILAVISDWHHTIRASVSDWFPDAVHQRCAAHLLQDIFRKICGKRLLATPRGKVVWKKVRKVVLEYDNIKPAQRYLGIIRKLYPEYTLAWNACERGLRGIYEWTKRRDLPIPRTSNKIENFMGVLEQRLKSMRTSKSATMLIRIVTAYIKVKYKRPTKE